MDNFGSVIANAERLASISFKMLPWKHIIWDWNGTLLDDAGLCVDVLNTILTERGMAITDVQAYREDFDFPVIGYYQRLGFNLEAGEFERVSEIFISRYLARMGSCRLHAFVNDILQTLGDRGISHSVLSAARQDSLENAIQHYGLSTHFSGLVGVSNILAHGKKDEGLRWVKKLPWPRREILLVGDTSHDHEVATAMGVDCALVAHGHHSHQRLSSCGAPVFDSFSELMAHLKLPATAEKGIR